MNIYIYISANEYIFCIETLFFIACNRGSYGFGCKERCGQCRDLNQCYHITGTCQTGCDPGYGGDMCNTSRYSLCIRQTDGYTDR